MKRKTIATADLMHAHMLLVYALALVAFGLVVTSIPGSTAVRAVGETEQNDTQNISPAPEVATEETPATIIVVGDIMLGRYVETLMRANGWMYPFQRVESILAGADHVIGNLEGPVITGPQTPDDSLVFEFEPEVADALSDAHFTMLSIDNNHSLDQGREGVQSTREHLSRAGIAAVGDPIEKNGGYVSLDVGEHTAGVIATNISGATSVPPKVLDAVSASRARDDLVIVLPHWGSEYSLTHSPVQDGQARELAEAGADIILGAHPHVVQDVQLIDGALVFYSLGNFVFDQYFSQETEQSLLIRISFAGDSLDVALTPLVSTDSQPAVMAPEEAQSFLSALADRSDASLAGEIESGTLNIPLAVRAVPE